MSFVNLAKLTSKAISRFFRNLEQGQSVLDSQLTSLNAAVDHIKQDVKGTSIELFVHKLLNCQNVYFVSGIC